LWECADWDQNDAKNLQSWIEVALGKDGRTAYATPNQDKSCPKPFWPVTQSLESCASAANRLWPGDGCNGQPWATIVQQEHFSSWPQGCIFYSNYGGCGLVFNPNGAGSFCPEHGHDMDISNVCELSLP